MMLQRLNLLHSARLPQQDGPPARHDAQDASISDLLVKAAGIGKRQAWLVLAVTLLGVLLGIGYLIYTPPTYTASATITVEARRAGMPFGGDPTGNFPGQETDGYVEIIKSGKISLRVIDELGLANEPEFIGQRGLSFGLVSRVRGLLGLPTTSTAPQPSKVLQQATIAFRANLDVKRAGGQALEISFRSTNPQRAADVVNAVVDAFILDQVDATQFSAKSSGVWLQARLSKLREDAEQAEQAVVDFKKQNQIIEVDGKILVSQRLTEMNGQLVAAKVQKSELTAKVKAIREAIAKGGDVLVVEIKESETLNRARQQLADLLARERDWILRYGPDHAAVQNVRNQIQNIRIAIEAEFGRLAAVYERELDVAAAKQKTLEAEFGGAIADSYATDQLQVRLRELESSAKTYRTLYEAFLQRQTAAVQQESFPSSAARILTRAEPPLDSSSPKALIVLAASLAGGLILGGGLGFMRDVTDHVLRRPEQVEQASDVRCLGLAPFVSAARGHGKNDPAQRELRMLQHVLAEPASAFTEAIRSIKFQIDRASGAGGVIVGVTSPEHREGKSTLAANLAELMALSGRPAVLVDCNVRNPALSQKLAPGVEHGLIELAQSQLRLHDAIQNASCHADFIASGSIGEVTHVSELLASPGLASVMAELRSMYKYVVLDLPPATLGADARTLASMADFVIIAAEWGKTDAKDVQAAVHALQLSDEHDVGVVLNKAKRYAKTGRYAPRPVA